MAMQGLTSQTRVIGIGSPSPLHMTYRLFGSMRGERSSAPRLCVTTPMPEVVATLNACQPEVITTYPSFVRQLAEEQQAGRLRISPKKFVSTAETLTPDVRELARSTWGAVVLNAYGATEVNVIGAECALGLGAHVPEDLIVLEVVDDRNRPVPPGVVGDKILVTTLYNRTFPLIRYEIADLLSLAEGPCPCGCTHRRIESVRGRREDLLRLAARDGGYVNVHAIHLHAVLVHVPSIRQFELTAGADDLRVRVALRRGNGAGDLLREVGVAVERELSRLGAATRVIVEPVEEIARSGTGAKQKLVRAMV
jgi:phenylacetate-coenzyme A ligase PaaK-like adenylate-forming protein